MARSRSPQAPTFWLGLNFLVIGLLLAYLLVTFWPRTVTVSSPLQPSLQAPAVDDSGGTPETKRWDAWTRFPGLGRPFRLDADVRLLILVMLAGALGSYVHAAQSFASYVGNASFKSTWAWWYILRLPVGASLALFVYFVIRGGLLAAGTATASGAANDLNLFGIMSFSGLAGLFSKQAADKLAEVFDTVFATKEDRKREDKLGESPRPVVEKVTLDTLSTGQKAIVVTGRGFTKASVVKAAGRELTPSSQTEQSLTASVPAGAFDGRAEIDVTIFNPPPGGGESEPRLLKIGEAPAATDGKSAAGEVTSEVSPSLPTEAANGGGAPGGTV